VPNTALPLVFINQTTYSPLCSNSAATNAEEPLAVAEALRNSYWLFSTPLTQIKPTSLLNIHVVAERRR
jgi:hypothetical protein